jgi:hypothetical protein
VTHARRGPLATTSAKKAAASPHVASLLDGPVWNRNTSVSGQSGKRNAKPKAAGSVRRSATVLDHGSSRTPATTAPATAMSTPRSEATTSRPDRIDPTRNAPTSNTRNNAAGGKNATEIAVNTPTPNVARTRCPGSVTPSNPDARMKDETSIGATANSTSGPRRPFAIALRAAGFTP